MSLDFSPYQGPGVDSAPSENEYQEHVLGVKAAGAWGWLPHHLHVPNVMKSGSLNLLEPSWPHRACYGTPLHSSTILLFGHPRSRLPWVLLLLLLLLHTWLTSPLLCILFLHDQSNWTDLFWQIKVYLYLLTAAVIPCYIALSTFHIRGRILVTISSFNKPQIIWRQEHMVFACSIMPVLS